MPCCLCGWRVFCRSEESLGLLCLYILAYCYMHALRNALGHILCPCVCGCSLPPPSGGQWGNGGPLRWDAADLHVGEGAPSLAAAVRDGGRGGDNVLQPVEGDDEQRQQEHQQAEEKPHININVARTSWWWGRRRRRGHRGRGETEEGPIVDWRDSGLIMVYQRDVHPWHPGWSST